jgi:hypothetical protein
VSTVTADRERLLGEIKRLVLAESDMWQVATTADYLHANVRQMSDHVKRVMWTGIAVTYARPFSQSNRIGAIRGKLARLDDPLQRSLHERLCELRDQLFAHTDDTELRGIVDTSALLGLGMGEYAEEHVPMSVSALPRIAELANPTA